MSALRFGAAAAALLLWQASPSWAQSMDLGGGGPVDVTASDGIEWRQAEQVVIARGDARAIRGNVTIDADRLLARYRPRAGAPAAQATRPAAGEGIGGGSEIFRLEAEGQVRIHTATDTALGSRAVYDVDQSVMVLTGQNLSLTTPKQVITARDSLEYWQARRMAVARGNALVVEAVESRRVSADTLVAYFLEDAPPGTPAKNPCGPAPAQQSTGTAASGAGPAQVPGSGRVDRVEAFGRVEIRTAQEVVRGDRGVYSPETGMARLLDNVRITRGDNQINGREAIVNLCTGVAQLVSHPGDRVQGLLVPQQDEGKAGEQPAPQQQQPQTQPQQQRPRRTR